MPADRFLADQAGQGHVEGAVDVDGRGLDTTQRVDKIGQDEIFAAAVTDLLDGEGEIAPGRRQEF